MQSQRKRIITLVTTLLLIIVGLIGCSIKEETELSGLIHNNNNKDMEKDISSSKVEEVNDKGDSSSEFRISKEGLKVLEEEYKERMKYEKAIEIKINLYKESQKESIEKAKDLEEDNKDSKLEVAKKEESLKDKVENEDNPIKKKPPKDQPVEKEDSTKGSDEKEIKDDKDKKEPEESKSNTKPTPSTTEAPKETLLVEKIKGVGNSRQVITVTNGSAGSSKVTIEAFEQVDGKWKSIYTMPGIIGRNGFATNKKEGDKKSPTGIYSLGTAFGRQSNPGTKMAYRQTTTNDYWVDDVKSPFYNTWQEGPVDGRWESAEELYISPYDYAFVINYNSSKTPGAGSAIFFHVWSNSNGTTSGCTATSKSNVINLLKWIDPSKNPIIIQGSQSMVEGM